MCLFVVNVVCQFALVLHLWRLPFVFTRGDRRFGCCVFAACAELCLTGPRTPPLQQPLHRCLSEFQVSPLQTGPGYMSAVTVTAQCGTVLPPQALCRRVADGRHAPPLLRAFATTRAFCDSAGARHITVTLLP